jgi:hypothetical protein
VVNVDVLAVEYQTSRCAQRACLRLADAVAAGMVDIRALAVISPRRAHRWQVDQGFPPVVDPGGWLSGYAALSTTYCGVPDIVHAPVHQLRLPEQFDPVAAARFCRGVQRPHAAVLVKPADPTPLVVLELLRPSEPPGARLLRTTLCSDVEELAVALLAGPRARAAHPPTLT